jgi:hypothetical protein
MPTKLRRRDTTPKHQGISNLEDMFFNYFEKKITTRPRRQGKYEDNKKS